MTYGRIPLFPPGCMGQSNLRVPLFRDCDCGRGEGDCKRVIFCNPSCPDEVAEVELCVDCDGNLSICVHRSPRVCVPQRRRRRGCECSNWCK